MKEPTFCIRAQDVYAIEVIQFYQLVCINHGNQDQAIEVAEALLEMMQWQRENSDKLKVPFHKHVPIES